MQKVRNLLVNSGERGQSGTVEHEKREKKRAVAKGGKYKPVVK